MKTYKIRYSRNIPDDTDSGRNIITEIEREFETRRECFRYIRARVSFVNWIKVKEKT